MTLEAGQPAPGFDLADQDGKRHTLEDYRGKWVVLYFYPKDNTPGCTKEACQFRDAYEGFSQREAVLLGVSPDDEASHRKFIDKFDLPFPLLADEGAKVCDAYGVWQEKTNYGRTYMGVQRATFLIDPQGKIAHVWPKVKVADHEQAVLEQIDAARA